jgi:hypothetical protein
VKRDEITYALFSEIVTKGRASSDADDELAAEHREAEE